jgi:hypothetical protein
MGRNLGRGKELEVSRGRKAAIGLGIIYGRISDKMRLVTTVMSLWIQSRFMSEMEPFCCSIDRSEE